MNSGYRKSTSKRGKIPPKINGTNRSSGQNSERLLDENHKSTSRIEEEDEDDDAGNISETMILPSTPRNKID
jgi:hypothetical protein